MLHAAWKRFLGLTDEGFEILWARAKEKIKYRYLLAPDTEKTGENMKQCFMPCFGAAIVDVVTGEIVDTFFTFVSPPEGRGWSDLCLHEFWLKPVPSGASPEDRERQEKLYRWYDEIVEGVKTAPNGEDATQAFVDWVASQSIDDEAVVVSDTCGGDVGIMDQCFSGKSERTTSMKYVFGKYRPPKDISSWMGGFAEQTFCEGVWHNKEKALKRFQELAEHLQTDNEPDFTAPKWHVEHDHRPDHDATVIALDAAFVFGLQLLVAELLKCAGVPILTRLGLRITSLPGQYSDDGTRPVSDVIKAPVDVY